MNQVVKELDDAKSRQKQLTTKIELRLQKLADYIFVFRLLGLQSEPNQMIELGLTLEGAQMPPKESRSKQAAFSIASTAEFKSSVESPKTRRRRTDSLLRKKQSISAQDSPRDLANTNSTIITNTPPSTITVTNSTSTSNTNSNSSLANNNNNPALHNNSSPSLYNNSNASLYNNSNTSLYNNSNTSLYNNSNPNIIGSNSNLVVSATDYAPIEKTTPIRKLSFGNEPVLSPRKNTNEHLPVRKTSSPTTPQRKMSSEKNSPITPFRSESPKHKSSGSGRSSISKKNAEKEEEEISVYKVPVFWNEVIKVDYPTVLASITTKEFTKFTELWFLLGFNLASLTKIENGMVFLRSVIQMVEELDHYMSHSTRSMKDIIKLFKSQKKQNQQLNPDSDDFVKPKLSKFGTAVIYEFLDVPNFFCHLDFANIASSLADILTLIYQKIDVQSAQKKTVYEAILRLDAKFQNLFFIPVETQLNKVSKQILKEDLTSLDSVLDSWANF